MYLVTMLSLVHGTSGTLIGVVLCTITESVTYRPHRLCAR